MIQQDERGRYFYDNPTTGERTYISPVAMDPNYVAPRGGDWTNVTFNPKTGEFESSFNWDHLGKWVGVGATTAGIGAGLAGAAAAGSAGGGGVTAGGGAGAGSGGLVGPGMAAGGIPGATYSPVLSGVGLPAAGKGLGTASAGTSVGKRLLGNSDTLKKIGSLGLGVTSGIMSRANQPELSPEVQQLLQEAIRRMMGQRDLYDSVTRGMQAGLPTYAKKGPQ